VSLTPHADVDAAVELRLVVPDADTVTLPVDLQYSLSDPFAVTVAFRGDEVTVEWVFARELLLTGLQHPSGDGDVHVWPSWRGGQDLVLIALSSPDGRAVLEADAEDLRSFLDATIDLVRPGTETDHVDLDAAVSALLT
jgi:hypothetical protein